MNLPRCRFPDVVTVDSMMGGEYHHIILDVTIDSVEALKELGKHNLEITDVATTNTHVGFLRANTHGTVMFSRAKRIWCTVGSTMTGSLTARSKDFTVIDFHQYLLNEGHVVAREVTIDINDNDSEAGFPRAAAFPRGHTCSPPLAAGENSCGGWFSRVGSHCIHNLSTMGPNVYWSRCDRGIVASNPPEAEEPRRARVLSWKSIPCAVM